MSAAEGNTGRLLAQGKSHVKRGNRLVVPSKDEEGQAFVVGSTLMLRVEFQGTLVSGKSFFKSFDLLQRLCFLEPCNGTGSVDGKGIVKRMQCIIIQGHTGIPLALVVPGRGVLTVNRQYFFKERDGIFPAPEMHVRFCPEEQGLYILRSLLQGFAQCLYRFLEPVQAIQCISLTGEEIRVCLVRIQRMIE